MTNVKGKMGRVPLGEGGRVRGKKVNQALDFEETKGRIKKPLPQDQKTDQSLVRGEEKNRKNQVDVTPRRRGGQRRKKLSSEGDGPCGEKNKEWRPNTRKTGSPAVPKTSRKKGEGGKGRQLKRPP